MKKAILKRFIFYAIILSIPMSCSRNWESSYDFGKVRWGMSKDQVIKTEEAKFLYEMPLKENIISLNYSGNFVGLKCYPSYYFVNNKLRQVQVDYVAADAPTDTTLAIQAYRKMKEFVIEKYGEGIPGSETNMRNYYTKWITSRSEIELEIRQKDSILLVVLGFLDKNR